MSRQALGKELKAFARLRKASLQRCCRHPLFENAFEYVDDDEDFRRIRTNCIQCASPETRCVPLLERTNSAMTTATAVDEERHLVFEEDHLVVFRKTSVVKFWLERLNGFQRLAAAAIAFRSFRTSIFRLRFDLWERESPNSRAVRSNDQTRERQVGIAKQPICEVRCSLIPSKLGLQQASQPPHQPVDELIEGTHRRAPEGIEGAMRRQAPIRP